MTTGALLCAPIPTASAAPCPDIEVVFARGTFEPPGVGGIGQSFVNSVRSQAGAKSVNVYPVNYPASTDFPTAIQGIRDAANHIEATAVQLPRHEDRARRILPRRGGGRIRHLGGGPVLGRRQRTCPTRCRPSVADHVAAVALFGKPSPKFMEAIGSPPVEVGSLYQSKTIDLCVANDPICTGSGDGATTISTTSTG